MSEEVDRGIVTVTAVERWANRISIQWGETVADIIDTGRLLVEAKAALPHASWLPTR